MPSIRLPADVEADEAAAISAAIQQLLAEEASSEETIDSTDPWHLVARIEGVTGRRVPHRARLAGDAWTASARLSR